MGEGIALRADVPGIPSGDNLRGNRGRDTTKGQGVHRAFVDTIEGAEITLVFDQKGVHKEKAMDDVDKGSKEILRIFGNDRNGQEGYSCGVDPSRGKHNHER